MAASTFAVAALAVTCRAQALDPDDIGREVSVPSHLQNGEEYQVTIRKLLWHGRTLSIANWTGRKEAAGP